ncbi:Rdh11 [Phodopus roborovskii]|uniref:Rdh11 protein n=1 Tax=Phodopus roborovskii TaxID=109678 RepID=A0AAU9ZSX4_PHORO|nr:Rdh11 [Phodopus roborovskii]
MVVCLLLFCLPFILYLAAPKIRSPCVFSLPGCRKGGTGG